MQALRVHVGMLGRWLFLCVMLLTPVAQAEATRAARHQPLRGLNAKERDLLAPFLERGPVGLVEFSRREHIPAIVVASYVEASAKDVAALVSDPAGYPKFMQTLDSVEVQSRVGAQVAYEWTFRTGILFMSGENQLVSYGPPPGKPEHGYRIAVTSERGHMGEGRMLWRILPLTEKRSLVVLSMRMDMRKANFVMEQLDAAARSLNRSINFSLGYVMVLGTKKEAERRAGARPIRPSVVPLEPPKADIVQLSPLLKRADIVLMDLTTRGIGKLGILGRTGLLRKDVWPVMTEPETLGKSLVPGSYTTVTKREGPVREFEWGIRLPLIGTEGKMRLTAKDETTVHIDAIEGAMKGGRWRFATPTLESGEVVVVGWSLFDITRASWLIEKVAKVDPLMGHGLAASTQVMMLRALRSRARIEKKAKARKHKALKPPENDKDVAPVAP